MGNIQNQISDPFEISGHIVVRDDHPQIRGPRTVKHDHIDHFVADFDLYTVDDPFVIVDLCIYLLFVVVVH